MQRKRFILSATSTAQRAAEYLHSPEANEAHPDPGMDWLLSPFEYHSRHLANFPNKRVVGICADPPLTLARRQ